MLSSLKKKKKKTHWNIQNVKDKSQAFTLHGSAMLFSSCFYPNANKSITPFFPSDLFRLQYVSLLPFQNVHDCVGLPCGILTLNYVVHASVIRFGVGIDVYGSSYLSVLWNHAMLHHSNFVIWAYHLCLRVRRYLHVKNKVDFYLYILYP